MTPRWLLWAEATNLTALPAILLVILIFAGIGVLAWAPTRPATPTVGRIVATGFYDTKSGRRGWIELDVRGRKVKTPGSAQFCAPGDVLPVREQEHLLWSTFSADTRLCAVARRTIVTAR